MRTFYLESERIFRGNLILVNASYPYQLQGQEQWFVAPKAAQSAVLLEEGASKQLASLLQLVQVDEAIIPVSGFRSVREQAMLFEDCLAQKGVGYTTDFVALPGHSEHHTGLAIDLAENLPNMDLICPQFGQEGVCGEFRKQMAGYGFIERYPKGKQELTGVAYEPWHFRYVGYPHAHIIQEQSQTLEEYVEYLRQFPQHKKHLLYQVAGQKFELFFVPAYKDHKIELSLPEDKHCQLSGNNIDGLIVTLW